MKRIGSIILTLLLLVGVSVSQNHVIIAVIDGARYTETFGDASHQYIPRMWNDLRPNGTIFTNYYNNGLTQTNPSHASILTGTWQTIDNNGTNRPTYPTVFEYNRKELSSPQNNNWVVLGKDKLDILSYSTYSGYGSTYQASVKYASSDPYDDSETLQSIKSVITTYHPSIAIINFGNVDYSGHNSGWNAYVSAIRRVDSLIYLLWSHIQSDAVMANTTTLIVTNDHGRHTTDFTSHGDGCEGCRHVLALAIGVGVPQGRADNGAYSHLSIACTVGSLLGFSTPNASSQIPLFEYAAPITLSSFNASVLIDNGGVKLAWTTVSEINNYGFYVQRKIGNGSFVDLPGVFIPGGGTRIGDTTYTYIDNTAIGGQYSYRLKQVDTNGTIHIYEQVVTINVTDVNGFFVTREFGLYQNYPNPFNPNTSIRYSIMYGGHVTMMVFDALGRHVTTLVNQYQMPGIYEVNFSGDGLSSGIYFYKLTSDSRASMKQMMLVK